MPHAIRITAVVAVLAAVGILALGLATNWALAVVIAIMVGGLAALIVPLESILYDERGPDDRRHG